MATPTPYADNGFVNDQVTPARHVGDNVADFHIPSAGIEDVDRAVYDLFNEQIPFQVEQRGKQRPLVDPRARRLEVRLLGAHRLGCRVQRIRCLGRPGDR